MPEESQQTICLRMVMVNNKVFIEADSILDYLSKTEHRTPEESKASIRRLINNYQNTLQELPVDNLHLGEESFCPSFKKFSLKKPKQKRIKSKNRYELITK